MSARKMWKFGSDHGWTFVIESSSVIADQVVKGQAIRVKTVPATYVEFGQETRGFTTTDAELAKKLEDHPFCGTKYWLVEGYPKMIEGRVREVPKTGPEPTKKETVRMITGAKGTGDHSFNTGVTRVKQKVG